MSDLFIKSSGYRKLRSFSFATLIYLETVKFCKDFLSLQNDPKGRLLDQMVLAARSGRANIMEGSARASTSAETEIRLTDVARGSLIELSGDYEMWIMLNNGIPWSSQDSDVQQILNMEMDSPESFSADPFRLFAEYMRKQREKFSVWLDSTNSLVRANALLYLCDRTIGMITRQLEALGQHFRDEGGFKERMTKIRLEERKGQITAKTCPVCQAPMIKQIARKGINAGKPFWGCSQYPACKAIVPFEE